MQRGMTTPGSEVKCSAAKVQPAPSREKEGEVEVRVSAPEPVLKDMMEYLAARNHRLKDFMDKYQRRPDIVQTFQCLAFLMEYCRHKKSNRLVVLGEQGGEYIRYILDLEGLNSREKRCSKPGCQTKGTIYCSRCLITYWCTEKCLEQCHDSIDHRLVCAQAEIHLKTLFPED